MKKYDNINIKSGFTLLEVIISTLLLSLIAILCSFALKNAILTYDKVNNKSQEFETKTLNYYRIFLQLKNIQKYKNQLFLKGQQHSLEFISNISITHPGIPGLFKVKYKFEDNTLKIKEIRLLDNTYFKKDWRDIKSYPFINGLQNLSFQYYTGREWQNTWLQQNKFPKAILISWKDKKKNLFKLVMPIILGETIVK